jgi:DNA-binding NarL/FixJ family response regulator
MDVKSTLDRKSHPIRIVIADDHPIYRDGLRRLLQAEPDLNVIGEAADGSEAVRLAGQLKPDILPLDPSRSTPRFRSRNVPAPVYCKSNSERL